MVSQSIGRGFEFPILHDNDGHSPSGWPFQFSSEARMGDSKRNADPEHAII